MKLKGISRFEQYADKIVFLVFALFLVFVLVMQVGLLGGAPTIDVNGKKAPIDRAAEEVKLLADAKRARLESDRVDERIPASVPSALGAFQDAMARARQRPDRMGSPLGLAMIRGGDSSGPGIETGYDVGDFRALTPPAPSKPVVEVFEASLDPISVAQIEPLAALVPAQQPYDVRTVSVLATFDAAKLRAMLKGEEGGAAIPAPFWQGRVELLDVEIYRQERDSSGQWSQEQLLSQIPGRFSLREKINSGEVEPIALRSVLDAERGERQDIRRPAMYHTVAGEPWTWPKAQGAAANPKQAQIDARTRRLASVRAEIERLQRDISDRPPAGGGERPPPTAPRQNREQIEKRIETLRAEETRLVAELSELGFDANAVRAAAGPERLDEPLASLTEQASETVTLWAHDFTARPGAAYRYKARVVVTNPYFGQAERLSEEQKSLAAGVAVKSEDSPWSDPVTIEPTTVFFVRSANDAAQNPVANRSRALVEIYQFFYGYWRRAEANLFPGDPVAATTGELPALQTWRIQKDDQGKWMAADPQPLERVRALSTDYYLAEVASLLGGDAQTAMAYLVDAAGAVITRKPESSGATSARRERLEASARIGQQAELRPPVGEDSDGNAPGAPPPRDPREPDPGRRD